MNEAIGQKLRQAREERSLSLQQAAKATFIRVHNLEAMEAGDFDRLHSQAQARGFLRSYAGYLQLDGDAMLREFDADNAGAFNGAPPDGEPAAAEAASPPAVDGRGPRLTSQMGEPPDEGIVVSPEAEAIFTEIGLTLRNQRDLLGLSIEDVERHTHLRRHYLRALEAGRLKDLPSPVQGRGMLNNYAAFLGLETEPLLLRFADGLQARLATTRAVVEKTQPAPARRRPVLPAPLRRIISGDLFTGGLLTLFLVAFVFWAAIRIFTEQTEAQVSPTAPSIADVLLASPTPTLTATPSTPTPTAGAAQGLPVAVADEPTVAPTDDPEAGEAEAGGSEAGEETAGETASGGESAGGGSEGPQAVQLYVTVQQRAWVRVLVDGEVEMQGRVLPGSAYSFTGSEQVEVLTGNGAALQIFFNDQDLGLMGQYGQVVHRIYGAAGAQTPTPTASPTPTQTPRVTPTPEATITPLGEPLIPALP